MKLFQKCETCGKRKFVIKKRKVILPTKDVALSQKQICRKCQKVVQRAMFING